MITEYVKKKLKHTSRRITTNKYGWRIYSDFAGVAGVAGFATESVL